MKKELSMTLAMLGFVLHGEVSAATAFINFNSGTENTSSEMNNILTLTLGEKKPISEPQHIVNGSASVKDKKSGDALLSLTSAAFTGCNSGANLNEATIKNNHSTIYEVFNGSEVAPWGTGSDVWGTSLGRNGTSGENSMTLAFSGLAANTKYTFYLMGGRNAPQGAAYCPAFDGVSLTVDGTKVGDPKLYGYANGGILNAGAGMFEWTFTTSSDWDSNKEIVLSATNGVYNAMRIDAEAVPEPSAAMLVFLPMVGCMLRRRRR